MNKVDIEARVQAILAIEPTAPDLVVHIDRELTEIAKVQDPSAIPILLGLFRDTSDQAAMYSVIHTIESFDVPVYIEWLLAGFASFGRNAPYWASMVVMRLLNDETARLELARQVTATDNETREVMAALLHAINAQSDTFKPKTNPVLIAATEGLKPDLTRLN